MYYYESYKISRNDFQRDTRCIFGGFGRLCVKLNLIECSTQVIKEFTAAPESKSQF